MRVKRIESLTPINLCPKRAKLSKAKIKHRRKPADRPLKLSPANRLARSVHRRVEKAPDEFPRKVRLRKKQKPRCLPRREQQRSRRTSKFGCAPTSFPSDAAGLHCRAMPSRIGSKRDASYSSKQARAESVVTQTDLLGIILNHGFPRMITDN